MAAPAIVWAKRPPPVACPGGLFVVMDNAPLIVGAQGALSASDAVALAAVEGADAQAAIVSGCPPVTAKLRAGRRGTKVKAKWPANACTGTKGRVRLSGRIVSECNELRARLAGKRLTRRFTAQRHAGVITPVVDDARAATGLVTASGGGSLSTTGGDGTLYTLTVPPGALVDDTVITMAPVSSVGALPAGELVAAVQLLPEGLQLLVPATLTTARAGIPTSGVAGFGAEGDGTRFHLDFVVPGNDQLFVPVTHFSFIGNFFFASAVGAAVGAVGLGYLTAGDPEAEALNALVGLLTQGETAAEPYLQVLRKWYDTVSISLEIEKQGVARALLAFAPRSNDDLRKGLRAYIGWKQAIAAVSSATGLDLATPLAGQLSNALNLAAAAVDTRIRRTNDTCLGNPRSLAAANEALRLQAIAQTLGLLDQGFALDLPSVLANLCVRIDPFEPTLPAAPADLPIGVEAALTVRAGHRFGQDASLFDRPLRIAVDAVGIADPSVPGGHTNAEGVFVTSLRPSGSPPLSLTVRACFDEAGLPHLAKVCASRLLAGSGTTSTVTTSTTSTTLAPASGVVVTFRSGRLFALAHARVIDFTPDDVKEKLAPNDASSTDFTLHAERAAAGTIGDVSATASATGDGSMRTTFTPGPGNTILGVRDVGSADAQSTQSHNFSAVSAGAQVSARLALDFRVIGNPVSYRIVAHVEQSMIDGGNCRKEVVLMNFVRTVLAEVNSQDVPDPNGTGRADIDKSGTLQPGNYRLDTDLSCSPSGDVSNLTRRVAASYEVNLTFGAMP